MTQMGIQVSSDFTERFAVHFMQSGVLGKIKEVHTFSDKQWGDMNPLPAREDKVPESLNWDLWLGPAAERPYLDGVYHPGNWRKRRDFGTGTLGDMGCHIFSSWFRGLDLTMPKTVKSTGPQPDKDSWALNGRVEYLFPGTKYTEGSEVRVTWYDGPGSRPPQAVADLVGRQAAGSGQRDHRDGGSHALRPRHPAIPVSAGQVQSARVPETGGAQSLPRIPRRYRERWPGAPERKFRLRPARSPKLSCSAACPVSSKTRRWNGTARG